MRPDWPALFDDPNLFGKSDLFNAILCDVTQIINPAPLATCVILREPVVWIGPKFHCMIQQKCTI